jgi:hypothetical protein
MNVIKELWPQLGPLFATLFASLLSGLGLGLQEWRQSRNERFQRKQARDEAEELIAVLEKWVQAEEAMSAPGEVEQIKQKARLQLDQAFEKLQQTHEHKPGVQVRPFLQRALLWYRPVSTLGWFAHILFYSLLILFIVFAPFVLTAPPDSGSLQWSDLLTNFVAIVLLFVPVLIVQAWATALDKKQPEASRTVAPPPSPSVVRPAQSSQPKTQ